MLFPAHVCAVLLFVCVLCVFLADVSVFTVYIYVLFLVCVCVTFQLVPSNMPLSAASGGFFFYYSLLGNDVTNETFPELLNPTFPAERASVRVRSSVDALRMFFTHQPGLQVCATFSVT